MQWTLIFVLEILANTWHSAHMLSVSCWAVCGQATPGPHPVTGYGEVVASQAPHHVNAAGLQKHQKWSTNDNRKDMECYYKSKPTQIGCRQRMHKIWIDSG